MLSEPLLLSENIIAQYIRLDGIDKEGVIHHSTDNFTLTLDKRVQKVFQEQGVKLHKGCQYFLPTEDGEPKTYLYAHLTINRCTLDQLNELERMMEETGARMWITIEHLVLTESISWLLSPAYEIIQEEEEISIVHPTPKKITVSSDEEVQLGHSIKLKSLPLLATLSDHGKNRLANHVKELYSLGLRLFPSTEFKDEVKIMCDKYHEFDRMEAGPDEYSFHGKSFSLVVDKSVQLSFSKHHATLFKGCKYYIGSEMMKYCYAKIQANNLTYHQAEYLDKQCAKRGIKAALTCPNLDFVFPQPIVLMSQTWKEIEEIVTGQIVTNDCFSESPSPGSLHSAYRLRVKDYSDINRVQLKALSNLSSLQVSDLAKKLDGTCNILEKMNDRSFLMHPESKMRIKPFGEDRDTPLIFTAKRQTSGEWILTY